MMPPDFALVGRRARLAPFTEADITPRYLAWLADREVNRYSRRQDLPPETMSSARAWLAGLPKTALVFAIRLPEHGHVGNIKAEIDAHNERADISIVLGERAVWGDGIGSEAIYLLTRYLFTRVGRVDAGTCNPAFVRAVEKLGWRIEGVLRDRVKLGGTLHDYVVLAQLRDEFRALPHYEAQENAA